ncbi:MAG: hypothetical protein BGN87_00055 [Rhizobiales bacterium 65-79]|nr:MAG: hypothetical protein BGN87_00055 [Rhizobiales bacterium 65-79]
MLTQIRLYLLGGALLAFLALGGVALWYRGEAISAAAARDKAQAALATAVEANRQAAATIDAMTEQSRLDGRLAADLAAKNRQLADDLSDKDAQLDEMEKQNADLRKFLGQPVPPELGRLYAH